MAICPWSQFPASIRRGVIWAADAFLAAQISTKPLQSNGISHPVLQRTNRFIEPKPFAPPA